MISCDTRMVFIDLGQRMLPEGKEIASLTRWVNSSVEISVQSRMKILVVVGGSLTVQNSLYKDARCYMMVKKGAMSSRDLPQRRVARRNTTLPLVH